MPIESINPATDEVTEVFEEWSVETTGRVIENSRVNGVALTGRCEKGWRAAVAMIST